MRKLLYCNKKQKMNTVSITTEEANNIEALNYEKSTRLFILRHIKENSIDVSSELKELYYREYVSFCVKYERAVFDLVQKYCDKNVQIYSPSVDFYNKILTWFEKVG